MAKVQFPDQTPRAVPSFESTDLLRDQVPCNATSGLSCQVHRERGDCRQSEEAALRAQHTAVSDSVRFAVLV